MAQRRKVWISCDIFTDDFLQSIENLNPNSKERKDTYVSSRYRQISHIRKELMGFLNRHKEISMEGFYISSGARYYIALFAEREYDHLIDELPDTITRLRNRPHTSFCKIDLEEQYKKLKVQAENIES